MKRVVVKIIRFFPMSITIEISATKNTDVPMFRAVRNWLVPMMHVFQSSRPVAT